MSGLVNGLQNRLQQFESARHLRKPESSTWVFRLLLFSDFLLSEVIASLEVNEVIASLEVNDDSFYISGFQP